MLWTSRGPRNHSFENYWSSRCHEMADSWKTREGLEISRIVVSNLWKQFIETRAVVCRPVKGNNACSRSF
ncbi:hypothetical protein TNCV_1283591 [Trichonephila clavipes]|uniref:Uncharacterized protein n=1 Tax=Trichonephila clavipes TaxID=2585209 RepID=A0A8X6VPI9_TRICX|nr:hypothetical protein TNCV_1283591 [Trichonephila clavipes]